MSEVEARSEAAGPSAGQLLRQAREAAGLHVATLAANLKVPLRKLELLEEDQYEQVGDAVFVRALASSVARTLKMDPNPVLERLPRTSRPRLVQDGDGINTPFRTAGDEPGKGWLGQISRPVALTVVALLLAALVLIFLPRREEAPASVARSSEPVMPPGTPTVINPPVENPPASEPANAGSAPLTASTSLAQPPAAAPAPAPVAAASAAAPAARASASAPRPAASAVVAAMPTPVAAASTPAPAALPASGAPIAAKGIVTFRARGSSWVQVTDAHGTAVFRKLMEAGESAGASGALPLSVTVGSVAQTEVQVRGKPYNMAPVSKDNVARFEVK